MTESDLGPLTWVKGEIDLALSRAGEALAQSTGSDDHEPLRLARNHVHQAHGALDIVGLEGVSTLTDAMERLLDAIEQGKADGEAQKVLGASLTAVRHYLDALMEGEPDQPLRLFPYYRALLNARGEAEVSPSDLFFPDLSLRPPRRDSEPLPAQTVAARIKAARLGYERGLLKWLKGDAKGLVEMRNSLAVIEQVQVTPAARALWWAGQALIDAIVAQAVPIDAWLKKLLGRIGRQAGKLVEGIQAVPDRLLRDVLYVVALAGAAAGEHAACVRAAWGLDALVPTAHGETDIAPYEARLRALRGQLEKAMENWNRFSVGAAAALPSFHDQVDAMARASKELDQRDIIRLLRAIAEVTDVLRRDPLRHDETLALEMATGLLLLEHALTDFGRLGDDFGHQVDVVINRLAAWSTGQPLVGLESPHLDELSQQAQEKLLMSQVSREILVNLGSIEQTLDTFFRDPSKGLAAASLEKPLHQVRGALIVLGETRAREVLEEAAAGITQFAAADYQPCTADFEAVAANLSALGLFVERLQYGPADIDAILAPKPVTVRPTVGEEIEATLPAISEAPSITPSAGIPISPPEAITEPAIETLPEVALPGQQPSAELPAEMPTLQTIELPPLETAGPIIEPAGEGAFSLPPLDLARAEIEVTLTPEASPVGTPMPETPPPAESQALDVELLEIFVEEGGEVLGTLSEQGPRLRASPHDREALTTVRRAYHTLKGSGRMVGLNTLGEAAWAVEQTLNQALQRESAVEAGILDMLDDALELFGRWIEQLRAGGSSEMDAAALIERCVALREGRAPAATPVVVPTTPPTPTAAPTEVPAAVIETEPPTAPTPAPTPETVRVGEVEVSPTLYHIYLDEAAVHLATLTGEIGRDGVPPQNLIRAAHTLAGISGTTGFRAVHQLAHALEIGLARFATAQSAPSETQRLLLARAVGALEGMIGAIAARRLPATEEGLVAELEELRPEPTLVTATEAPIEFGAVSPAAEVSEESPVAIAEGSLAPIELAAVAEELSSFELPPLELPDLELPPLELGEALPSEVGEATEEPIPEHAATSPCAQSPSPCAQSPSPCAQSQGPYRPLVDSATPLRSAQNDAATSEAAVAAGPKTIAETKAIRGEEFGVLDLTPLELAQELDEIALRSPAPVEPLPPEEEFGQFAMPPLDLALELEEPNGPVAPVETTAPVELTEAEEACPLPPIELPPLELGKAGVATPAQAVEMPVERPEEPVAEAQSAPAKFSAVSGELPSGASIDEIEGLTVREEEMLPLEPGEMAATESAVIEPAQPEAHALSSKVSPVETPSAAPAGSLAAGEFPVAGMPQEVLGEAEAPEAERRHQRLHDDLDMQLLPLFLEESEDLMRSIGEELRAWHAAPQDTAIATQMKRLLHTLKGGARMAGAMGVGELVHAMESRIERAQALKAVTPAFLDDFDTSYDRVALLIETLRKIAAGEMPPVDEVTPESAAATPATAPAVPAGAEPRRAEIPVTETEASARALLRVRAEQVDRLVNEAGEIAIARARIEGEMRTLKASLLDLTENVIRLRNQLREIDIQAETQMSSREMMTPEGRREFDPLEFDRFTRFQELTRMMAESVGDVATIQQNLLANLDRADAALVAQARLNRELSQALMSIRMVPLSSLAERLHRIVRQTAKEMDKRANLDIRGGQTELDRSVLEHITSPLEHLLRNAIAHGLEPAEVRKAAGKPEIGEIVLAAAQEGNEMVITLRDDGAGLNLARIREKAIAQGLIGPGDVVDEQTLIGFIFQSGFSTAGQVSAVAGRGIGMDVVKTEVTALGGRLEVETQAGQGSTFRIWLPLTLAVTQALLIKVAGKTYAIPSAMVEQASEMKPEVIAQVREQGQVEWLGRRYPWNYLPRLLGEHGAEPTPARRHWLLLLKGGQQSIALEVDGLVGNEEIVVKNIGPQLSRVPGIAGATVLPDGEIVLILNPIALAARANALAAAGQLAAQQIEKETAAPTTPVVMVVDDSLTVRKITSRLLSREGYEVITAKDGQDAIEKMADFVPDVVLSDIEMPRMDGFELARHIRNDERLKHTPIIMITSRTADKHKNVARDLGVDHYLGKPYDEDELLRLIAEVSARHRNGQR